MDSSDDEEVSAPAVYLGVCSPMSAKQSKLCTFETSKIGGSAVRLVSATLIKAAGFDVCLLAEFNDKRSKSVEHLQALQCPSVAASSSNEANMIIPRSIIANRCVNSTDHTFIDLRAHR
jgi:hypothetical protein